MTVQAWLASLGAVFSKRHASETLRHWTPYQARNPAGYLTNPEAKLPFRVTGRVSCTANPERAMPGPPPRYSARARS
jgi:hypothetical protein